MLRVRREAPAPADLGSGVIGVVEGSPLVVDVRLEAVLEGVLVTGTVCGRAAGQCGRCLIELDEDVEAAFTELFAYPGRRPEQDADEDDVRELEGDLIDLEPALRDAVVPALPFQPMCRDDCPGLCSECGARLSDDPGHQHDVVDPRWAALHGLAAAGGGPTDPQEEN
jgi:uncharacterized protein